MNTLKVGSLLSGIGGIDLGFQQVGFEIAFANELDKNACKTYRYNFKNCNLIEDDIRNINAETLPCVDVLTAGFPFQSFLIYGSKKEFKGEKGNLFFEIIRIADALQPPVIFLESAANLAWHDNGKSFITIHNELASRDYFIRYIITDSCDYGIPQHRSRLYMAAFKSLHACRAFRFPARCNLRKHIFDVIDKTVKVDEHYYLSQKSSQYKRIDRVMTDPEQIYRFSDHGVQSSKDGISFTLKANMGTWHNRVPFIRDNFGIRKITPYECLALQGFPKEYRFPDIPIANAYKQCGNTVCVPIIKNIAEDLKTNLYDGGVYWI